MYSDELLKAVLVRSKIIAVVGISKNPARPSHYVSKFMMDRGHRIIPVNPGLEGQTLLGERVYARVADVPIDVDMVDIFRRSEAVPEIVDEALARWPNLATIWMQIGVQHAQSAEVAQARGVTVIQNRCPKAEYPRLFGNQRLEDIVIS